MQVEETAKAADVVGVPGGQGEVGAGGVHGPAQLLLGGAEAGVGLVGLAAGRGLLRPARSALPCASLALAARWVSAWVRNRSIASSEHTVASTSTPVSTPPSTAIAGLRRAHRQYRSAALTWRARIGSSARNRLRSSPIASADWYRALGSFSIAFRTIVSRSRGIRASMRPGPRRLLGLDLLDQLEPVRRVESRAEREQLVERQPQRVDVGPGIPFAPEPLGGHVADRAQDVAGLGQPLVVPLGQAEIGDPDHAFGVQQQVRRLDVAVHDPARVGVGEAPGDLPADLSQAAEERAPTRLDRRELGTPGQDRRA